MNLLTIDIGNTNITTAHFADGIEVMIKSVPGDNPESIAAVIKDAWEHVPFVKTAKEPTRDGIVLVSSVKPQWTEMIRKIVQETIDEKIKLIPGDFPIPMEVDFKKIEKVGSDRLLAAVAAYEVVQDAVIIADFGTAVTIDVVNEKGVFLGGTIMPGFAISAKALNTGTAQLPEVIVKRPDKPFGQNTNDAINCGLYYSAIGALQEIIRRYSEHLGRWPQTVITGSGSRVIKDDCDFIDSFVSDLVVKGMVISFNKYFEEQK